MPVRVIDNKRVDVTEAEWAMYERIVKSYTTATNKGQDLFRDLFESDDRGIITFLKPPSKYRTSLEVYLFLMSLCLHQHLRLMHNEVSEIANQMKQKMAELDDKLKKLSDK